MIESFHNLTVLPTEALRQSPTFFAGGPVIPEHAQHLRFHRNGKPRDKRLGPPSTVNRFLPGEHCWVGPRDFHYGHFIADFFSRVAFYSSLSKVRSCLVSASRGSLIQNWFGEELLHLFGFRDIHYITEPTMVEYCLIAPQGEQMIYQAPTEVYLDALANVTSRFVRFNSQDRIQRLFVTRPPGVSGTIAGLDFVTSCFEKSGGLIFNPLDFTIEEQIDHYVRAEEIIFLESSALHTFQLLPRLLYPKTIKVLNRRPGTRVAESNLISRNIFPTYLDFAGASLLSGTLRNGYPASSAGLLLLKHLDFNSLLRACGLFKFITKADYRDLVEADVLSFLEQERLASSRRDPQSLEKVEAAGKEAIQRL